MKLTIALATILIFCAASHAELRTEVIEYKDGDTILEGYLAYDDAVSAN